MLFITYKLWLVVISIELAFNLLTLHDGKAFHQEG